LPMAFRWPRTSLALLRSALRKHSRPASCHMMSSERQPALRCTPSLRTTSSSGVATPSLARTTTVHAALLMQSEMVKWAGIISMGGERTSRIAEYTRCHCHGLRKLMETVFTMFLQLDGAALSARSTSARHASEWKMSMASHIQTPGTTAHRAEV
jgi:hypothetical protein